MQELQNTLYSRFFTIIHKELRFTWRDQHRLRIIRARLDMLSPLERAAIHGAAMNDSSPHGQLIWRAFVPDEDSRLLPE